jgi:DNA-binding MarR family transcriptional regulator
MLRLYSLTDAGRKAWDTQSSRVPLDCRRVLGLVEKDTDPRDLSTRLGWSESAVKDILKELEEGGLVRSLGAAQSREDLDFTGSFRVEDFEAAARQHMRRELDFTQPLSEEDLRAAREKKD